MMGEWKKYKLKDVCTILGDGLHGTPIYDDKGEFFFINGNNLKDGRISIKNDTKRVPYSEANKYKKPLNNRTILVSINGTIGNVAKYQDEKCILGKSACFFNVKENVDLNFIYYVVANQQFKNTITQLATGTTIKNVSLETMRNYTFCIPPLSIQKQIGKILSSFDDKIELNRRINDNLEQQAQALFKSWFVDFEPFKEGKFVDSELGMIPESWGVCSAETIFKINIGKTPPRKEQQWFSNINNGNVKWISISDLGSNEIFIEDSKEYLTKEAISKFNIIVVPEDTILVSFKLTVGRVGISNCELTTNEAVARFYLPKSYFREYTYLSLKNYNYARLGSTSSIATAVNSKIIKNMKLLIPPVTIISEFNKRINPLFNAIRIYENEIRNLSKIRNTLLPELMSGELKINDINN